MDMLGNYEDLRKLMLGYSFTDEQTAGAIEEIYSRYKYIVCPHTAVAWLAVEEWRKANDNAAAVFLATAHPFKFPNVFPEHLAGKIEIPQQVEEMKNKPRFVEQFKNDFNLFKEYLLKNA